MNNIQTTRKTNFRWVICAMLFFATTVNYLDRQALSLTWKDFIAPEFHWTNTDYGNIAAAFSIMYAIANFFSGRIIDWLGTRRGYLWAIGVWSAGACLHALCGWATEQWVGLDDAAQLVGAAGDVAATVSMVSVWFFLAARVVLVTVVWRAWHDPQLLPPKHPKYNTPETEQGPTSEPPEAKPKETLDTGRMVMPSSVVMGLPMMVLESTIWWIFSMVTFIRP